ncbi:histidinol-phosphate transaminase [Buchnera aphidicola]|uniref:Histidinol-phosphate aminotransferase n=1 Tax=Buchnera aphidicola (Sarucallis kahawaluokalani) TaxID=1241878 RepID=A0A4D6Y8A5_9GAMM|nr:histidinol-phosphate transaminase [Buchnera aphidicola]QCI25877.1 histidinol-phosphate transaminase [Buchnera aphidicola (Sarucallis kahawaluokalani)]
MESNIYKLCRKDIFALQAYASARSIGGTGTILLNANELPVSNIVSLKKIVLNRYPECQPEILLKKYANYINLHINNILVSRGADEAIELLMRVFCTPYQDSILTFPPTYTMYAKVAEIYGVQNISIPLIDNIYLNIPEIIKCLNKVKLIYICRPNNPTGHIFHIDEIIKILELTINKAIVVIDEAYIEFCINKNIIFLLTRFNHLVILRTLSKAFGLAGIRCGFTIAHHDIIQLLRKVITPYPLPIPSIEIAVKSLSRTSIINMKNKILLVQKNKFWLLDQLKTIKFIKYIFDSETNYILVRCIRACDIFNVLWNKGIILRKQDHIIELQDCIRISIGTKIECLHLFNALKEIVLCE